jgi:hypothetical protein
MLYASKNCDSKISGDIEKYLNHKTLFDAYDAVQNQKIDYLQFQFLDYLNGEEGKNEG